jgi:hypothetical protein
MKPTIEGNIVSFMVEPKQARPSKSGKTLLAYSTGGFIDAVIDGIPCKIGINVTCAKD